MSSSALITFSIVTINFSGRHYLAYKQGYREIEEIMVERGIHIDGEIKNASLIAIEPSARPNPADDA